MFIYAIYNVSAYSLALKWYWLIRRPGLKASRQMPAKRKLAESECDSIWETSVGSSRTELTNLGYKKCLGSSRRCAKYLVVEQESKEISLAACLIKYFSFELRVCGDLRCWI